ncbi:unnamed protein product [Linum trigynum]|uniref:Uncharacterized protein n=1 Tax=Linum trigynum TaxID=586398 RepID=A0AAV2DAC8_9ROSI
MTSEVGALREKLEGGGDFTQRRCSGGDSIEGLSVDDDVGGRVRIIVVVLRSSIWDLGSGLGIVLGTGMISTRCHHQHRVVLRPVIFFVLVSRYLCPEAYP